jgi:hypothetical protein
LDEASHEMHGRTLEETFVYENLELFQTEELSFGVDFTQMKDAEEIRECIYTEVRDQNFKKTDFALSVLSSPSHWQTPAYIEEGLKWLEKKLAFPVSNGAAPDSHDEVLA